MITFNEIFEISAARKGGAEALSERLKRPLLDAEIARLPDAAWLSAMARCIFQAGFSWTVVEAKWPGFEAAFEGFVPSRVAMYHGDDMDRLLADKGIIRNPQKITAVIDNAIWLDRLSREPEGAGRRFALWPENDLTGLLELFARDGSRLGGATGQRVLRTMGKSSFVLSRDVTARLVAEGVLTKQASSRRDMARVQEAFNIWAAESGRSFTEISQVLAQSIGPETGEEAD